MLPSPTDHDRDQILCGLRFGDYKTTQTFFVDGRYWYCHTETLLKLIEPAKAKFKRAQYIFRSSFTSIQPQMSAYFYTCDKEFQLDNPNATWFERIAHTEREFDF